MPIRLTDAQRAVLRDCADLKAFRSESGAALYDSFGSSGRNINRQIKALREKGLVQLGERAAGQLARFWRLTDEGRSALAGGDTRPKPPPCMCSDHVEPHTHATPGALGQPINAQEDEFTPEMEDAGWRATDEHYGRLSEVERSAAAPNSPAVGQ